MRKFVFTCPNCQYQTDFLSALQSNEQREFMALLVKEVPEGLHRLIMRYINLFTPRKNAMSYSALTNRTKSLLELIKSGRVERNNCTRVAPEALWMEGMELLTTNKPDNLTLPLRSHAYLEQVVFSAAEKREAEAEAKAEQAKRDRVTSDDLAQKGLTDINQILRRK